MKTSSLNVPLKTLVSLVSHLVGGYEDPDHPLPHGPWDPVIRKSLERVREFYGPQPEPWAWVALNPQPLPPLTLGAVALARSVVDQVSSLSELSKALPEASQESVATYSSGFIKRFIDDCGNGIIVIHIPRGFPWPPGDDEPKPIGPEELVVIGAQLVSAAAVHQDLEAAGIALIEMGLNRA